MRVTDAGGECAVNLVGGDEVWRYGDRVLNCFWGECLNFHGLGVYGAKGGCQLQGKGMYEGYSRYENVYAKYTLSARLRVLGAIHFDRSLLLMLETYRAMEQ